MWEKELTFYGVCTQHMRAVLLSFWLLYWWQTLGSLVALKRLASWELHLEKCGTYPLRPVW